MAEDDMRELPSWTQGLSLAETIEAQRQLLAAIETITRAGYTAEGLALAVKVLGITDECRRALSGEVQHA